LKSAKLSRTFPLALMMAMTTWTGPLLAFENVQVHGFINQGYFLSSGNNMYGNSDSNGGTLDFTEIGINGSIQALPNLRLAIQGIYRHAGQTSNEARIDYALLDWTAVEEENYQLGIRLGRVKNPLGFYNDTRDVAFTRPSIFLPQGIYLERSRNLYLGSDGIQFYLNKTTSMGNFSLQVNAGKLDDDVKEVEIAILNYDTPGYLDMNRSYMGKLEFESNSGATRLALSYADIDMDYKPGTGGFFSAGDISFELFILSAQQSFNRFTLTAEYHKQYNIFEGLGPLYPEVNPISENYYLQGDYRFNDQFQATLRYDVAYLNKDDKNGELFTFLTGGPSHAAYSKDYMAGIRWTPNNSWMVQAEYHRIDGTSTLSFADNPDLVSTKQHWNLFALQLSYRF